VGQAATLDKYIWRRLIGMITIPYTYLFFGLLVVVGFGKMGQIDEEIGLFVGVSVGVLAVLVNHWWPGGYKGLAINVVVGFVVLTVYKIVREGIGRRRPEE